MLSELNIENLAVIPDASIQLQGGLNVITGETGAGKTILARAIALLLGSRADSGMIRPGATAAVVEAVFEIDEECLGEFSSSFDLEPGEAVSVRRKVSRDGRSRAYVCGRATTVAVLQRLTARLLAFSAQHEQRDLMMAGRQLDILDSFAGAPLADLRDEFQISFDRRQELAAALAEIARDTDSFRREAELLEFQVAEIEAAGIAAGEDAELEGERQMLLNAGELKEAAAGLGQALVAGEAGVNVMDSLALLLPRLQGQAHIDSRIEAIANRLQDCVFELEDLGRESIEFSESVVDDPQRLGDVEERLDLLGQLKRKYGPGLDDVLAYMVSASDKLAAMDRAGKDEGALREELEQLNAGLVGLARKLRQLRREAAVRLEQETARHLGDLAFADCGFSIVVAGSQDGDAISADLLNRNGADTVEFFVRLNAGMPPAPLRETASGGELSRIMLAVKSAISSHTDIATLVFDEIDAGIGGETGTAVGQKLKSLAAGAQVICITHLPQIACFADAHFSVVKRNDRPDGISGTEVRRVAGDECVDELCRMMGSDPADEKARAHVDSLLSRAASC